MMQPNFYKNRLHKIRLETRARRTKKTTFFLPAGFTRISVVFRNLLFRKIYDKLSRRDLCVESGHMESVVTWNVKLPCSKHNFWNVKQVLRGTKAIQNYRINVVFFENNTPFPTEVAPYMINLLFSFGVYLRNANFETKISNVMLGLNPLKTVCCHALAGVRDTLSYAPRSLHVTIVTQSYWPDCHRIYRFN